MEEISGGNLGDLNQSKSGEESGLGLVNPGGARGGDLSGENLGIQSQSSTRGDLGETLDPAGEKRTRGALGETLDPTGERMETEEPMLPNQADGDPDSPRVVLGRDLANLRVGGVAVPPGEGATFRSPGITTLTKSMRKRNRRKAREAVLPKTPDPQAQRKGGGSNEGNKRNRSLNETPPEERQPKRPATIDRPGRTYAEAASPNIELAVVLGDYPKSKMERGQVRLLEEGITDRILQQGEEERTPIFRDRRLVRGALVVQCESAEDRRWLEVAVPELKPWDGAALRTMSPEQLEVYVKCIIYTASGKDGETVLKALQKQNATLQTGSWELVNFIKDVGGGDSSVMVNVPREQWEAIERQNCRLNYGLGRANCVLLRKARPTKKAPTAGVNASPSSGTSSAEETSVIAERRSRMGSPLGTVRGQPGVTNPGVGNVEVVTLEPDGGEGTLEHGK